MNYDANGALLSSAIPGLPAPRSGKVRDLYDLGDTMLLVATDRISAFDVILPNGIPDKGRVLTMISKFWFEQMTWLPNHLITMDPEEFPEAARPYADDLRGRSMLVKKVDALPVECVARGYLVGSGWNDYQKTGAVCGIDLRQGYQQADKLDTPLFTPAFKAEVGEHDENISYARTVELVGADTAEFLRTTTLKLYSDAANFALTKDIIIADTKFEFGRDGDDIILIDEVLTPDSSRFWPADKYAVGSNPPSLDKQFVRDYLAGLDWDKTAPGPELPAEVVLHTAQIYKDAYKELTGKTLA